MCLPLLQFNQDLYSSSGVPLAASSNASGSSHSPCSPILPPSIVQSQVAAASAVSSHHTAASSVPTIPLSALHRHITKEEDLSATRSDNEGESSSKGKMGTTAVPLSFWLRSIEFIYEERKKSYST